MMPFGRSTKKIWIFAVELWCNITGIKKSRWGGGSLGQNQPLYYLNFKFKQLTVYMLRDEDLNVNNKLHF